MSTHEAYYVLPPQKINAQIESIAGYGNNVLLGTRQGHLLLYSVEPNDNKMKLQLLQYNGNFSKKPVVQIEVVPEYQLLFSLSDNIVTVNDINRMNFPIVHTATRTKGATVFTLDIKTTKSLTGEIVLFVRLCVAVKRKLQFWYWKNEQLLELASDIDLNDIPKTLAWSDNTICVGFRTEYVLYELSGEKKELFPTSSSRTVEPCITLIGSDIFGVAKDEFLIAVDPKNLSLPEMNKSAQYATRKEDFSTLNPTKEGTKSFKSLSWSQPIQMVVWDEPYVVSLINDSLEVRVLDSSGPTKETFIQSLPDLQRAKLLIKAKQGLLFAASTSNLWCVQSYDIPKQRINLLKTKRFQLALQLTNISDESKEDKEEKIHNIQTRYAYDLFENKHFQESMKEFAKLKTDPCNVIRLFPDLLPPDAKKSSSTSDKPNLQLEGRELENGLLALIDYLTEVRYNLKKEMSSSESKPTSEHSLLSIIDTALLKCYLQTNDSLVAPLLRLNFCHLKESELVLKQYQKYGELIILYQTKGYHRKALEVLLSQSQIPDSCLFGYERTIQYLQHLGSENKQLIFDFAGWVIDKHPEDGIKIFTEDIQEVESLPRAEVLDYLLKNHKSLVITYLEHIIHFWDESKPIFHNILIKQYREKIKELKQDLTTTGNERHKELILENIRKKLIDFLKKTSKYNPETVLHDFPYNDLFEERAIILGKLNKHEKVLAIYIQILGDITKSIEYCNEVHERNKDVYLILLKLLLKPPSSPPYSGVALHPKCLVPDIETVLEILEKYGGKVNPHAALQLLPDNIPLWRLKSFLEVALHNQLERKRKTQVLKGLLYAEHLQIQEQRLHNESQSILLTDFSVCPVCSKKFTNQSAFVRYPNGTIVHYSCQTKQ